MNLNMFNYLTPQQYCSLCSSDVNDTLGKLTETVNDLTALNLLDRIESDDILNLFDPINNSLSEFTTYSASNGLSVLSTVKQTLGDALPLRSNTIIGRFNEIFDFTDQEISELGLLGCMAIAREMDSASKTVVDFLKSATYLPATYSFTTINQSFIDMNEHSPTYDFSFQNIYQINDEFDALIEAIKRNDYVIPNVQVSELSLLHSMAEFYEHTGLNQNALINILDSQQYSGHPCRTVLEYANIRYAKKYECKRNDLLSEITIYKMANDVSGFRIYRTDDANDFLTALLKEVTEESAAQGVLQKSLSLAAAGESKISDLASYLGQGFESTYSSTKNLISTISGFGSSFSKSVATAMRSMYNSMVTAKVTSDNKIEWGDLAVPAMDTSIGSIIVGVASTALQVIGTFLVVGGGLILKIAGALAIGVGYVINGISTAIADAADTFPEFNSNNIDQIFGYPIYQKDGFSTHLLPHNVIKQLTDYGSAKIYTPWFIMYVYNYDPNLHVANTKIFLNITCCSGNGKYGATRFDVNPRYMYDLSPYVEDITVNYVADGIMKITVGNVHFDRWMTTELMYDAMIEHGSDDDHLADWNSAPCTPDYYNVRSKDADDYLGLWSNILNAVVMTFAMFCYEECLFVNSASVTVNVNNGTMQFSGQSIGHDIGVVGLLYAFGMVCDDDRYNNMLQRLLPDGCNYYTPDIASTVVNTVLPWLTNFIDENFYNLFPSLGRDMQPIAVLPWSGFDEKYAVTPPSRTLASLIFAVVLTATIIAVSLITFTVVKKIVSRKAQPWLMKNIHALSADQAALDELEVKTTEDVKAKKIITKEYLKRVRHFNLITSLLGMGTYDVMADWFDGPSTIGGSWALAANEEVGTVDSAIIASDTQASIEEMRVDPVTGEYVTLYDVKNAVSNVSDDVSSVSDDVSAVKQLIKGV